MVSICIWGRRSYTIANTQNLYEQNLHTACSRINAQRLQLELNVFFIEKFTSISYSLKATTTIPHMPQQPAALDISTKDTLV